MKETVLDYGYVELIEAWGCGKEGHEDKSWGNQVKSDG